ncbi:MAG: peptidylprolyl isomerase [Cyanobacteriota bacterium]|nr:peptidylprolyl isomerase [Cyanobacteriota bacterium]
MIEAVSGEILTDEQRGQALRSFAQERGLDSQEALQRFCQTHLLSAAALNHLAELPLRVQLHCQQHYSAKAEARFLARKHQLDQVVYSLLRLPSKGLARELFLQLQEGESNMAELSTQFSEGPERATCGIVGPVPLAQAHPLLVERLRSAEPGVLVEPFQIEQWWVVVRLESLRPATFDQRMSLQMGQELFDQWLDQQVDQKVQQLGSLVLPVMAGLPE